MIASTAGNICTSIRESMPIRRPRNRIRLKAYAAAAPISRAPAALPVARMRLFFIQVTNGYWSLDSRVL